MSYRCPPEKQVDAARKTWLDRELYKQSIGKPLSSVTYDPVVKEALEQRKNWLIKHDLALIQSNGQFALRDYALNRLDKLGVYTAGRKLAEKMGVSFSDAQVKVDTVMRYEGFVKLETGVWASVTRDKILQLAPISAEASADNPRKTFSEETIAGLAQSIKTDGLLQNLVVFQPKGKSKKFKIISCERRFRALQMLHKEGSLGNDYEVYEYAQEHCCTSSIVGEPSESKGVGCLQEAGLFQQS